MRPGIKTRMTHVVPPPVPQATPPFVSGTKTRKVPRVLRKIQRHQRIPDPIPPILIPYPPKGWKNKIRTFWRPRKATEGWLPNQIAPICIGDPEDDVLVVDAGTFIASVLDTGSDAVTVSDAGTTPATVIDTGTPGGT